VGASATVTQPVAWVAVLDALKETMGGPKSWIVLITKGTDPATQALRAALPAALGKANVRNVILTEMETEKFGEHVGRLGVTKFPTVVVMKKKNSPEGGLALVGYLPNAANADAVTAWLGTLDRERAMAERGQVDPSVVRTDHYGGSPQAPTPQIPSPQTYA